MWQIENETQLLNPKEHVEHKKYSRRGMIKRVLTERRQKADKAEYRIQWAGNIYGDHIAVKHARARVHTLLYGYIL